MTEERHRRDGEQEFSIELKSMQYVRRMAIPQRTGGTVLFECLLGRLDELSRIERVMPESKGYDGTLRIEVSEEELRKLVTKGGKTR